MILECCSQERTYSRFFGLLSQRLCNLNRVYQDLFDHAFQEQVSFSFYFLFILFIFVFFFLCSFFKSSFGFFSFSMRQFIDSKQTNFEMLRNFLLISFTLMLFHGFSLFSIII